MGNPPKIVIDSKTGEVKIIPENKPEPTYEPAPTSPYVEPGAPEERYGVGIQVQGEIIEKKVNNSGGLSDDFGGRPNYPVTGYEALSALEQLKSETICNVGQKEYNKKYKGAFDKAQRFITNAQGYGVGPTGGDITFTSKNTRGSQAIVDINVIEGVNLF